MVNQQTLDTCARATKYYAVAAEYLETYTIVAEKKPQEDELPSPKLFLLCHALENALKGWLVLREQETMQGLKRKYGHDLVKLAQAAGRHYVRAQQNLQMIEDLNSSYWGGGARDYEYPEGNPSFVVITPEHAVRTVVTECVNQLIVAIERERRSA